MKALSYTIRFRRVQLAFGILGFVLTLALGLAHEWTWWAAIWWLALPAALWNGSVRYQWHVGRMLDKRGRMICHNSWEDGVPSNAAWDACTLTIKRFAHKWTDCDFKLVDGNIKVMPYL